MRSAVSSSSRAYSMFSMETTIVAGMPPPIAKIADRPSVSTGSIERFYQHALLALVTSGYGAVVASGALDLPTSLLAGAALIVRALMTVDLLRWRFTEPWSTVAAVAYVGFYPVDYYFVSRDFLQATVHLVFFL